MNFLRKFWPLSFKLKSAVKDLVIPVVIYILLPLIVNIVLGILRQLPGGFVFAIIQNSIGSVLDIYCTAGIAFCFLNYFKVGPFRD